MSQGEMNKFQHLFQQARYLRIRYRAPHDGDLLDAILATLAIGKYVKEDN